MEINWHDNKQEKGLRATTNYKNIYKNMCDTDKASIAHQLNTHFINIGRELAGKLSPNNDDDSPTLYKVYDFLMGTNLNKLTIGVPRKFIKLASSHISDA